METDATLAHVIVVVAFTSKFLGFVSHDVRELIANLAQIWYVRVCNNCTVPFFIIWLLTFFGEAKVIPSVFVHDFLLSSMPEFGVWRKARLFVLERIGFYEGTNAVSYDENPRFLGIALVRLGKEFDEINKFCLASFLFEVFFGLVKVIN